MTNEVKPTLSVYETARVMGVTAATVYAWCRAGELPHLRLGGRVRVPTAKLAEMLGMTVESVSSAVAQPSKSA